MTVISYQIRPNPEFSWSYSRARKFNKCKRKYYYQYYGSHNGWLDEATERARQAYRLKKMDSALAYIGNEIHDLANRLLKVGVHREKDEYFRRIRQGLVKLYKESCKQGYREAWRYDPKRNPILKEVYLNGKIDQRLGEIIRERLENCINNLVDSQSFQEALVTDKRKIYNREDVFEDTIDFQGITLYAQPDLVYSDEQGRRVIVDWKTGKKHQAKDRKQLELYYYYFYRKRNYRDQALLRLEYLYSGDRKEFVVNGDRLPEIESMVSNSIEEMRQYIRAGDVRQNAPLPEGEFPINQGRHCYGCRFIELCPVSVQEIG